MGICCSETSSTKLKVDEMLDNLAVFKLSPRETYDMLNRLRKGGERTILESEFLRFVTEYACPSEFSHYFFSFWKRFYAFKPEEDRDAHLIFGLILFSEQNDEKIDLLMSLMLKRSKPDKKRREAISYEKLKLFISNVFKSYSFLTLRHFASIYEDKEEYLNDCELAFLECNVDKFIFEKYFPEVNLDPKLDAKDLRNFLVENMHTFDKISSIRINLREFEKVSENAEPLKSLYSEKRLGDTDSAKGN